ncbi:MAG: HAMP domain-containing protein [Bacteroidia bacterium]|nr:HAMP domain-containing protein [Bacteroidia bacterium]
MLPAIKLKTKLQLSFLFIGFISILITGWQAYESAKSSLESVTFQRLTALRESRRRQIEYYFARVQTDIISYSGDRTIADAARDLTALFPPALREAGSAAELLDAVRQPGTSGGGLQTRRYIETLRSYDDQIEQWRKIQGYYDVFIIDAVSGAIVYSARREGDFASSLTNGPYAATNLAEVFRLVSPELSASAARFVDFEPYAPSGNAPASFVAYPVHGAVGVKAVLALQLSIDDINSLMTESNVRRDGMGASGETYIVGTDYRMRNDSRFFIEHPAEYYAMLRRIGTDANIIGIIRKNNTSVLLQDVRTDATKAALRGITDTRIVTDYRGVRVLSSFTPLSLPDLHWVMLSEIDETEAFRSVYELRERLILVGLVILLFAVSLGMVIAQTVTKPILSLAETAARFGRGDLAQRAVPGSNDEIGTLARTFNTMAEEVQTRTDQLESEIAVRTRAEQELTRSQEELRNLSMHLQSVREAERKGFAREIHDELGQRLTTMKLQVSLLLEDVRAGERIAAEKLDTTIGDIDATIQAVKRLISELRPGLLDDLGLTAAIEWQAEEFERRSGIHCELSISPHDIALDQDRSTAVFRIFQETLTNVARHSGASGVTVFLTDNGDEIELVISDDGRGITQDEIDDSRSFGLIGIRERALVLRGTAVFLGKAGEGTVVSVHIPKD